jgi:hypothetical protein
MMMGIRKTDIKISTADFTPLSPKHSCTHFQGAILYEHEKWKSALLGTAEGQ